MDLNEIYINTLSENSQEIKNSSLISLMLNALVSKYSCKQHRENFLISIQQAKSSEAGSFATNYIDCHGKVIERSSTKCKPAFEAAYKCLESSGKIDSIPVNCVNSIEELIQCNTKL